MFVLNTWYVAAWSHEVNREPTALVVCELPLVLYRTDDGAPIALANRCAHRAYPLSAGRLVGNDIECGYHGFTYGPDGACVRVPAQGKLPSRARVTAYPVFEKDGWIWIWPGEAELADTTLIPDTHWMVDPEWATVTHKVLFKCRHDLIHDNLLDLTHESFLHKTTVGDDYIYEHGITVEVDGSIVSVDRFMPAVQAPPLYARTMGTDGLFDRFHTTEFHVPGYHVLHSGITPQGSPREEGYLIKVLNGITPVDARTTWYHYAFSRNFAVDAQWATDELKTGLATVLQEDADALELQEQGMQSRPVGDHDVLIGQDAGVSRARRILRLELQRQGEARGLTAAPETNTSAAVR